MSTSPPPPTPPTTPHYPILDHIRWVGDAQTGYLSLLDQTQLPLQQTHLACRDVESVWQAIKRLSVRGAPAIGIAAAFGCVIAAQNQDFLNGANYLATSRPTAVNLFWAIDLMKQCAASATDPTSLNQLLLNEAQAIHQEDRAACRAIGTHALKLLRKLTNDNLKLLTHCNAGALATGGIGTATAPMYLAAEQNLPLKVYADETRPLLQGARLTAYELQSANIDVTLLTDSMAAMLMQQNKITAVITGSDRIAANGDVANKIGTYNVAILAKYHKIPFIVAAPTSTFDLQTPTGQQIPIEQRSPEEITEAFGKRTAPPNIQTYSPAFDITPANLVTAIITERGTISPISTNTIANHLA